MNCLTESVNLVRWPYQISTRLQGGLCKRLSGKVYLPSKIWSFSAISSKLQVFSNNSLLKYKFDFNSCLFPWYSTMNCPLIPYNESFKNYNRSLVAERHKVEKFCKMSAPLVSNTVKSHSKLPFADSKVKEQTRALGQVVLWFNIPSRFGMNSLELATNYRLSVILPMIVHRLSQWLFTVGINLPE